MRITKVYTRTGDRGSTRLVGGATVHKDDARIEAYGTVDELNAILGIVRAHNSANSDPDVTLDQMLATVQNELFDVGSDLATPADARWENMHRVGDSEVTRLEDWIDTLNEDLEPLKEFVLPGGGMLGAHLHQARTVCRRGERRTFTLMQVADDVGDGCLRYLNRLSDFLFVLGRWAAKQQGVPETLWKKPTSG